MRTKREHVDIHIRLAPEVHAAIVRWAERNSRSLNGEIEAALKHYDQTQGELYIRRSGSK